jgi:thiamine biosynthesis protein ThiS
MRNIGIILNGESKQVTAPTLAALVSDLRLDPRKMAVERNLTLVPRSQYEATPIMDGDRIEIVAFIGGG